MLPGMQNKQPMGQPPMSAGQPPMGQPQGQGEKPDQGQVVEAIKQVLQRIKTLADQNGIDLMALMSEMGGSEKSASAPPPPMPAPPPM